MTPSARSHRYRTTAVFGFVWVVFLAGLLLAAFNRQAILDWWALRGYQPPSTVSALATEDTLTPYARKVLYVNRPQVQAKAAFKECNLGQEQAAILGCYHGGQRGIFVLSVDDSRLSGIEQVTAAHEMLHAAYERLSSADRKSVDSMLEDYYKHDLHDTAIQDQMKLYQQTEPDAVVDEMHSVFGTEVSDLPSGLEQYYQRYFQDRSEVTTYYDDYQGEFTSRQNAVKADDTQLKAWKTQIATLESSISGADRTLTGQRKQLDTYSSNGDIDSYNGLVRSYNTGVNAYNTQVQSLKSLIIQYNQLVDARNKLALEAQQLTDEITTQVSPIEQ